MVHSLDTFSTELLLKIFKYLELPDLCRLKETCKRFNEIIENWVHSLHKDVRPLVTNQVHPKIANRSGRLLSPFQRLRISRNWKMGIYKERNLLYTKTKYIPWLQLEKELLWVSRGCYIYAYKRNRSGINTKNIVHTIGGNNRGEVCGFVKRGNSILSGQTDGSLRLWSLDDKKFIFNLENHHTADIHSVAMNDDFIVSGSRDNHVKIRSQSDNATFHQEIDLRDRVWSVALSEENKSLLAIGTAGKSDPTTVTVYDINSQTVCARLSPRIFGAGVLDIKWESPSLLWSCGYDSYLSRWDLRTGNCEQALGDPGLATVYCFEYDHVNSIVSGTDSHGRVVLWDTRQVDYVQVYFMTCCRRKSSPVYGLSHDAEFLFTVTDQHVNFLDFSLLTGTSRDYANLFGKTIKV